MIIKTQNQFDDLITEINSQESIAVDTEFFWMRTYYPELCLIQIATSEGNYAIDTLDNSIDYSALANIFEAENIEKIMHSGANDIPIIKRFFNCDVRNIFDTQIASTFLGYQNQLSLKAILKDKFDIDLEKEAQFSDWRKRPLTDKQEQYALNDVRYLLKLKELLKNELSENDVLDFFACEMKSIVATEFTSIENAHIKLGNIQKLSPKMQQNAILLARWREAKSQEKDKPVRYIFDNRILFKIAQLNPQSIKDFTDEDLKKLNPKFKKAIVDTIKDKQSVAHLAGDKKSPIKLDEAIISKINSFFDSQADKYNIENSFISSRKNIKSLAYNLKQENDISDNKLMSGWRYKLIGKSLKEYILDNI